MSEHTPTPWRVCENHPQRAAIYIKPEEGWIEIAALYAGADDREVKDEAGVWQNDINRMANAAFIVKAVNSHDALVKALDQIANVAPNPVAMISIATAALASIKERA